MTQRIIFKEVICKRGKGYEKNKNIFIVLLDGTMKASTLIKHIKEKY